jgi:hypothetical protein
MFPIKDFDLSIPTSDLPGGFGCRRRFDVHTGIDLYCEDGTPVYAMTDGHVVSMLAFTGPGVGSPWWEDTDAVMVQGKDCVILYGEIHINQNLALGMRIHEGDLIGHVKRVLRNDKGLPMSMLHLEKYASGTTEAVLAWPLEDHQPESLLDPYSLLKEHKG